MKQKHLNKYQMHLVEAMEKAKINKHQAIVLAYIAKNEDAKSIDIQKATGMKQPEVSIAIRDLEAGGWVSKKSVKLGTSGRPHYEYRLEKSIDDILDDIEDMENSRIQSIKDNLNDLKIAVSKL